MDPVALYESITLALGEETGATDNLLHVHAGMAVLLVTRVISGRSLATSLPFLVVCVFALGNEVLDRISYDSWKQDTLLDFVNTVFWPLVLMIGLRVRRSRGRSVQRPERRREATVRNGSKRTRA